MASVVEVADRAALPERPAAGTLYRLARRAGGDRPCVDAALLRRALERGLPLACACGVQAHVGRSRKAVLTGVRWYVNCGRYAGHDWLRDGVRADACAYFGATVMPAVWRPGGGPSAAKTAEARLRQVEAGVEQLHWRVAELEARLSPGSSEGSAAPPGGP